MYPMFRFAAGALAAAGALCATLPAAEAAPADSRGDTCFHMSQIVSTRMAGFRTLYMRGGPGEYYRMDFAADCNNLGSEPLVMHPFANNDEICHAIDLNVSVRGTGERCLPTNLTRLTPDEVAAIPPKDRP
jgi:hypothetical protein